MALRRGPLLAGRGPDRGGPGRRDPRGVRPGAPPLPRPPPARGRRLLRGHRRALARRGQPRVALPRRPGPPRGDRLALRGGRGRGPARPLRPGARRRCGAAARGAAGRCAGVPGRAEPAGAGVRAVPARLLGRRRPGARLRRRGRDAAAGRCRDRHRLHAVGGARQCAVRAGARADPRHRRPRGGRPGRGARRPDPGVRPGLATLRRRAAAALARGGRDPRARPRRRRPAARPGRRPGRHRAAGRRGAAGR